MSAGANNRFSPSQSKTRRMPLSPRKICMRVSRQQVIWAVVLLACIQVYLATRHSQGAAKVKKLNTPTNCKGWRETALCLPFGPRTPSADKACKTLITQGSGYCECTGGITTERVSCGHHHFTCEDRCTGITPNRSDALMIPEQLVCKNTSARSHGGLHGGLNGWLHGWDLSAVLLRNSNHPAHEGLTELWRQIAALLDHYSVAGYHTPSVRTSHKDWVQQGRSMSSRHVEAIREKVQVFREAVPPYPEGLFKGRGIAIVGGKLRYLVPAWLAVVMLRRTGCQLPVEMWFPVSEAPPPAVEEELLKLGTTIRILDYPGAKQEGFAIKASVLLLSSFEEVLFLDADVTTVRDPTVLFTSLLYQEHGALLWPDFWESTAAPDLAQMLDIPPAQFPTISFESGEMVIHKKRHWVALLMAVYMNTNSHLFHELLSCYLGKGDKESFAFSMLAAGTPFNVIPTPIKPVGFERPRCKGLGGPCHDEFAANTMAQHGPQGELMFLHANMDKWGLRLPASFSAYKRRWVSLHPDLDFVEWSQGAVGTDLEQVVFEQLQNMSCKLQAAQPFDVWADGTGFNPYGSLQHNGFHAHVGGLQFLDVYRQGMRGTYLQYVKASTRETMLHNWNRYVRPLPYRLLNRLVCIFRC